VTDSYYQGQANQTNWVRGKLTVNGRKVWQRTTVNMPTYAASDLLFGELRDALRACSGAQSAPALTEAEATALAAEVQGRSAKWTASQP